MSFEEALAKDRTVLAFTGEPLKFSQIGQLAWAGQGVRELQGELPTEPSAESDPPIKLYVATQEGFFVYGPDKHRLEQTSNLDIRGMLASAIPNQAAVADAGCSIVVTGSMRKFAATYGKKARTHMMLQAGHVIQNIQLQATSMDLGYVPIDVFDTRSVSRACKLPRTVEPIYVVCVGYPVKRPAVGAEGQLYSRKAVLIIASENFRDEELFETRSVLDEAGVETIIASSRTGLIRGMLGNTAQATIGLNELNVADYDAIVFVGGSGAVEYFENRVALNIARQAASKRKVLAAICIAPAVLANAGVLNGVRATSFLSERGRLQAAGAIYTGTSVERDGLIITASDPRAAGVFGAAIAEAFAGR
jgi:protease I